VRGVHAAGGVEAAHGQHAEGLQKAADNGGCGAAPAVGEEDGGDGDEEDE